MAHIDVLKKFGAFCFVSRDKSDKTSFKFQISGSSSTFHFKIVSNMCAKTLPIIRYANIFF